MQWTDMENVPYMDEVLTLKQLAEYLKVNEKTIYRLIAGKKVPAFKVGGAWRFLRGDIDGWIKQQSVEFS